MFRQCALCVLILFLLLPLGFAPAAEPDPVVHPLLQESLFAWYRSQAEAKIDPAYAGAHVMLAVGDTLYLGLSASVPTQRTNGPVLAAHDGTALRLIAPLNEQDVNRIRAVGDLIFIPGYDPNSGWDAGNLYRYDTRTGDFTRLRYRYDAPHFVDATTTDADGLYRFSGLKPTAYIVKFILPDGYAFTAQEVGYDYTRDSNPSPNSGVHRTCSGSRNTPFRIDAFSDLTVDAGAIPAMDAVAPPAITEAEPDRSFYAGDMTLGDRVWLDLNQDGVQDPDEPGLPGVRVELYTQDPYFPCVIHSSGFWGDAETGTLYYNGGVIYTNITFASDDLGLTWRAVSQDDAHYWARDLIAFDGGFFKVHREIDYGGGPYRFSPRAEVLYSTDLMDWSVLPIPDAAPIEYAASDGNTWTVRPMAVDETNALVPFQDRLVLLGGQGAVLYAVTGAGQVETIPVTGADLSGILPGFREPDFPAALPNTVTGASNRHNTLANARDELLYAIGGDNVLYATPDLRHWYPVADFAQVDRGAPLISLTYWAERGWLVAATAGESGSIYYVEHDEVWRAIAERAALP